MHNIYKNTIACAFNKSFGDEKHAHIRSCHRGNRKMNYEAHHGRSIKPRINYLPSSLINIDDRERGGDNNPTIHHVACKNHRQFQ